MRRLADVLRRSPSGLMAWRNLNRTPIRSGLAALGIVIGVLAISSLGMIGGAIQYSTAENLGGLTSRVTITPGQDHPAEALSETDVRDLQRLAIDEVVVPQKTNRTTLRVSGGDEAFVSVVGVTRADALYSASAGTVPDRLRAGALLGSGAADELGLGVGDPVSYEGTVYRIVGIVESQGFGPGGGPSTLVLPVSALAGQDGYDRVTVVAADGAAAERYAARVEATINADEEVMSVSTFSSVQENIEQFTSTLNLALLGIGSISLIVASVAILNVMLMSTIERRGEIGLLRAVGIRRIEVLRMILAEAALLGLLGATVGTAASLGIGLAINHLLFAEAGLVFTWNSLQYLVYGLVFGVFASLVSGLYPAWKAANDPPVEALRGS